LDGAPDIGSVDQEPGVDLGVDQAPDGPSACDPALDLKPLALDGAYCVTRRFDLPAGSGAFALRGDEIYVFGMDGTPPIGSVQQATIDPVTGKPGAYSAVLSFTPTLSGTLFPSEYVALSPAAVVAVGYTQSSTFEGELFWGDKGIKTPKLVDKASGNFDAIFLDDTTLLINGAGVGTAQEGQGVYLHQGGKAARRLIKEMGAMSGFMALGSQVVFAGGYFTGGSKIYGFTLAKVKAAIAGGTTLTPSDGQLVLDGSAGDAVALGDDLVVATMNDSWMFKAVSRIPITVSGNQISAGQPVELVTGSGASVSRLAASGARLALLLQGSSNSEVVIVEQK